MLLKAKPKLIAIEELFSTGRVLPAVATGSQQIPSPSQGMHSDPQQSIDFGSASWQNWRCNFDANYKVKRVEVWSSYSWQNVVLSYVSLAGQSVLVLTSPGYYVWNGSIESSFIQVWDPSGSRLALLGMRIWAEVPA